MIHVEGLSKRYGARVLWEDVNWHVRKNDRIGLCGPNGAGKSTLVRCMLGLQPLTSGEIVRRNNLRVGYVPQRFSLTPNVPLDVSRLLSLTLRPSEAEIDEALAETGIAHLKGTNVVQLSGGELQRALLARALLRKPEILVLDEPVQAVDFMGEARLYELISAIRKNHGCGILMVSHDLHMVMAESDHVVCLNGHVCCEGGPAAVQQDPEFAKLFGPSAARMIAAYTHHHDHDHEGHHHHHDHRH